MMSFNTKLAWLPIYIILTRNLLLFHEICNGNGPKIFPTMLIFARLVMVITTQEPQEKIILLHLSARKVQVPAHSTPVSLVCGTRN